MKKCTRCKEEKPLTSFVKKRSGNRRSVCRKCVTTRQKLNRDIKKANLNKIENIIGENGRVKIKHINNNWITEVSLEEARLMFKIGCVEVINSKELTFSHIALLKKYIRNRDNHTCAYCGEFGNTMDHIIPQSEGGCEIPSNLLTCCEECNVDKCSRSLVDFVFMDNERIRHFNNSGYSEFYKVKIHEEKAS